MLDERELKSLGVRIKNREVDAYHLLYTEYFADLRGYAQRFVYDYNEAEDIVQDAYFSLWENIRFYQPEQNVLYYLLAIVRNQCYNYLRKLRIQDEHQDKLIEAVIFSGVEDPEVDEDMRKRLYEVLAKLSPKGRTILLEHVLKRKKVKTIASEMGIAESSVKTHLKRTMRILRDNLCFILLGC
jgi:RNA polymerase sigma-70 factor (ECF subfamily)